VKKKPRPVLYERLGVRLIRVLERYRRRWKPVELPQMARRLREFAIDIEIRHGGSGRKR
jgi:hypothetical protein